MKNAQTTSSTSVSYPPMGQKDFMLALKDAFPLSVSVFTYGIAYGALAHSTNHLNVWQTLSMSLFVFAGASQFSILALLHQGTALWTIVGSTFLLNSRQALYGFTLGPHLRHLRLSTSALLAHGLTDESYSVAIVRTQTHSLSGSYFAGAGSAVLGPWLLSSLLGFLLGGFITNPGKFGLDFSYIGAFLGLLVAQLTNKSRYSAALLAAVGSILAARWLGTSAAILTGAVLSFGCGVMRK